MIAHFFIALGALAFIGVCLRRMALSRLCESDMTDTLTTVAVLGAILFGIIPFGADWWRDLKRVTGPHPIEKIEGEEALTPTERNNG